MSSIYDIKLNNNNNDITDVSQKPRKQLVLEGLDLILSLFVAVGQQRLFPRKVMTKYTSGQITAYSKEQILYSFEQANYEDCRINAYPAFISKAEEQDYIQGINLDLFAPNILFIDLDLEHFKSKEELDHWLKKILKNIANVLYDAKPLVLWSGRGYHIVIPVKAVEALEQFEDFESYTNEPSKEFLQFAARHLSLNKDDPANNPSFKSCLLRVPHTFNSKCIEEWIDAEVKIIHTWDSSQLLPRIDNLLVEFQTYLVGKKLKTDLKQEKLRSSSKDARTLTNNNIIPWIERLFEIAIEHNREYCVWRIFAPYFVNNKKLENKNAYNMIKDWLDRCNSKRKLDFDGDYQIRYTLNDAINNGYLPISFDSLKIDNPDLYKRISSVSIHSL